MLGQPENAGADDFVDVHGHARGNYDVHSNALVLVRPDGYVGYFSERESWPDLEAYLMRVLGASGVKPSASGVDCGLARLTNG